MILDSSALVAIALDEPGRAELVARINTADTIAIAAPSLAEVGIVLSARTGQDASELVEELLAVSDAIVIEFGPRHWQVAVSAWWRFGRSRHPASLDFGDCLTYAAAQVAGEPLLARGDDFARTDIQLA